MDYYPPDTIDTVAPQTQPSAPLVPYQGGNMQWLTPRLIVGCIGGVVILTIAAIALRGGASTKETIKVAPIQDLSPTSADVNKLVLENSKVALSDLQIATNLKIEEVIKASVNERAQEVLIEARKQVKEKSSNCFASDFGTNCFILNYLSEQQQRFASAIAVRDWNKANNALFNIKAARVAMDGSETVPFTPPITSAAIIRETEARINIAQQSDTAIAADIYGAKSKK